mgnify:CR=1 FL=1
MDITIKNIPEEKLASMIQKYAANLVERYIEKEALKPTKEVEDAILAQKEAFLKANKITKKITKHLI